MSENSIETCIVTFFRERGKDIPHPEADLFELQIIDSMELLELVMHLEEKLGLEVDQDRMKADNFRSLVAILDTMGHAAAKAS
jgi:acyl carrier protein